MTTTLEKIANPQGKGIAGVVNDLHAYTPLHVSAKSFNQWLADYFSSLLVLSAQYKFKPVVGNCYYLYLKDGHWKLSLIEPQAWHSQNSGIYFASCEMHLDMSWSVEPCNDWEDHELLSKTVKKLQYEFLQSMKNENPIVGRLPFYFEQLPYYQRLGANALARSLKLSLQLKLGNNDISCLSGLNVLEKIKDSNVRLLERSAE